MTQILQYLMQSGGGSPGPDASGQSPMGGGNPFMDLLQKNQMAQGGGEGTLTGYLQRMGMMEPFAAMGAAPTTIQPGSATSSAPVASAPADTMTGQGTPMPAPRPAGADPKKVNNPMSEATGYQVLDENGNPIQSGTFGPQSQALPQAPQSPYAQPSLPPEAVSALRSAMLAHLKGQ